MKEGKMTKVAAPVPPPISGEGNHEMVEGALPPP
jgi:hypothetical protein